MLSGAQGDLGDWEYGPIKRGDCCLAPPMSLGASTVQTDFSGKQTQMCSVWTRKRCHGYSGDLREAGQSSSLKPPENLLFRPDD